MLYVGSSRMIIQNYCVVQKLLTSYHMTHRKTQLTSSREYRITEYSLPWYARKKRDKHELIDFRTDIAEHDITYLLSRVRHSQTNDKIERFFGSLEARIQHYDSVLGYIQHYDDRKLHFSLDTLISETSCLAFKKHMVDKKTRENTKWMEIDSYE